MQLLTADPRLVNSSFGRLETRLKIVSMLMLVVVFSTLQSVTYLAAGLLFLLALAKVIGVPMLTMARRAVWILPFAGVMIALFPFITPGEPLFSLSTPLFEVTGTIQGVTKAAMLALRVFNATFAVSLLVLTTPLRELLQGLNQLRVPGIIVSLISFTLRYFQVLVDEVQRMRVARKARCFERGRTLFNWHTMRTLGMMLGTLFVRSAERGERIFVAMLSRGYQGEIPGSDLSQPKGRDWATSMGIICFGIALKLAEWRGIENWL